MKSNLKLDVPKLEYAAKKISILNHPDRIKIINLLEEKEKLNVTQIFEKLNYSQAEASIHLILMRKYSILNKLKQGRNSIYSLNREAIEYIIKTCEVLCKK